MTFYVYRAQSPADYELKNVNVGDLAGVMWYIQNEIVSGIYGDVAYHGVARIVRLKLQVRATQALLDKGMNFGVRVAFDEGKCTGPDCDRSWRAYGYNVGCNNLGSFPFPSYKTHYPGGVWYSLSGSCPSKSFLEGTPECAETEPGGKCVGVPTGAFDCTWNYEPAGQIMLTELSGSGFWAQPNNTAANTEKVRVARALFEAKYGKDPPSPPCDFALQPFYS